jgi:nucleoside-diphosphate-sugar epimerase
MRIAITGSEGVVGRAVVDLAHAWGHTVVRIDRSPGSHSPADSGFIGIDVTDYPSLVGALGGCNALIHLAAISGPGRHADHVVHNNNVVASYNALRAAAEVGIDRVCQASSINAIGGRFSRRPRYDYFPVDEAHPTYAEDPYSLSKWICEQQADAIARRFESMSIASLRLHGVVGDRADATQWADLPDAIVERQLWGYTRRDAAARACILAVTADFRGHEPFYVVAPDTMVDAPSSELSATHYPNVPIHAEMIANRGFFDCGKAERILGWAHHAS